MECMAKWCVVPRYLLPHCLTISLFPTLDLLPRTRCNDTYDTAEWQDERPPAPSYLRILYLGKILQDDDTLTSTLPSIPTHP